MPPAVWVPAAAGLIGGGVNAASQRSARKSQERANQQAIQLEREREAEARRRYDQQMETYRQAYAERQALKNALLRRYGINLPGAGGAAGGVTAGAAATPAGGVPAHLERAKMSLSKLLGGGGGGAPVAAAPGGQMVPPRDVSAAPAGVYGPVAPPEVPADQATNRMGLTLGDFANWSDWRRKNYASP